MRTVSIIMPAYNCEKFIKQAIDSILNQTYSNFELLIADDCSIDSTKQIIDAYTDTRIKRFHNEKNLGYLQASNKLFAQCTGEYITFQDADDYSDLTRLEKLLFYFENDPSVSVVGSNHQRIDELNNLKEKSTYKELHQDIKKDFLSYKTAFTGAALMLKKNVLNDIGIYNLFFDRIGSEDYYLFSLILDNFTVSNHMDCLYYYRVNSNSVSVNMKNPKSKVLHELVIFLHQLRQSQKNDYLMQNDYKTVNVFCEFLLVIKFAKQNKLKAILQYLKLSTFHPISARYFFRDFLFKVVKA